jgi:hypothetical protein
MRSVRTALAAGLALIVAAGVLVLSQAPVKVLASNLTQLRTELAVSNSHSSACQGDERLARDTSAIRISLGAFTGPPVDVKVLFGGRVITAGQRGSGWDGQVVTIPVKPLSRSYSPVRICFAFPLAGGENVQLLGSRSAPAVAARAASGEALAGRVLIEDLGGGSSAWFALLPSVAKNMGFGRAWSGTWVVFLVAISMLAVTALASRLILRELDG